MYLAYTRLLFASRACASVVRQATILSRASFCECELVTYQQRRTSEGVMGESGGLSSASVIAVYSTGDVTCQTAKWFATVKQSEIHKPN